MSIDEVSEEEVELPDGDVDVVRVDTEAGVQTVGRFLQPLPVSALQAPQGTHAGMGLGL